MAWPSTSARTKTWGTEILTASDLDGQFDLLHTYNNDQLNGTTGHGHTGGTNDGPKLSLTASMSGILPVANGGTSFATYTIGDILYASASGVLSKLSPSTAGQAITSAGAGVAPTYSGMTTQGDTEYHNGTTRTRLAPGNAGDIHTSGGAAANPSWAAPIGAPISATAGTAYLAATAGILCADAQATATGGMQIDILSDTSNPPTTVVRSTRDGNASGTNYICVMEPIRRGYYYKVVFTNVSALNTCRFYPLGG
jgi:hypothetical protein